MPNLVGGRASYRRAWDEITAMPLSDQLAMYEAWGEVLGCDPGHPTKAQLKRERIALAITLLHRAREHHGLSATEAPTIPQYDDARRDLDLPMSHSTVWRLFGGWEWAQEHCIGGHAPELSPRQVNLVRAEKGILRVSAPYIEQIREWLDREEPISLTAEDYVAYVIAFNDALPPSHEPLVGPETITKQLGIYWEDAVAVAQDKMSLRDAQEKRLGGLRDAGPMALIGKTDIARLRGRTVPQISRDMNSTRFPVHVAVINGVRARLLGDVRAYYEQRGVPRRTAEELQDQFLDSRDMQERLGRSGDYLRTATHQKAWHRIPKPAGSVSQNNYWLRGEVENWSPTSARRQPAKTRRARRKTDPRGRP